MMCREKDTKYNLKLHGDADVMLIFIPSVMSSAFRGEGPRPESSPQTPIVLDFLLANDDPVT